MISQDSQCWCIVHYFFFILERRGEAYWRHTPFIFWYSQKRFYHYTECTNTPASGGVFDPRPPSGVLPPAHPLRTQSSGSAAGSFVDNSSSICCILCHFVCAFSYSVLSMRIPTDAWFSIVGLLVSQPVLRRRGGLIIVIIIVIDIFNENYCKGHCSEGEIMTRKVKCHSKSNSFVAAAEQVCLQPVLEHRQRRGRRFVSSSQLLKSVTRTLQLCE